MSRNNYSPEFKAKIVLELLGEEKELNALAAEHEINPNQLRNWKNEFMEKASRVFDESKHEKELQRKEKVLEAREAQMLKTIGQLTIERDFLQQCGEKLIGADFAERYRQQQSKRPNG